MKIIEVDDELYQYIASKTENIGEQASDILRRLLGFAPLGEGQLRDAQSNDEKATSRDEEIEVVIQPELETAKAAASQLEEPVDTASQYATNDEKASTEQDMIAEPQGVYEVNQTPEQDESEVKTTTVKAQQAKHAQLSEQDADDTSVQAETVEEAVAETLAETVAESMDSEKVIEKSAEKATDNVVDKSTAKPARKVKARRAPKAKPGPSDEQLMAPVKGLDLPLIVEQSSVVGRFLYILSTLENKHGDTFKRVLEVQGKGRLYFATSKQELSEAGSNTNPKQIGKSTYWVMTNSNTDRKKQMLSEVSKILGYSASTIETLVAKL